MLKRSTIGSSLQYFLKPRRWLSAIRHPVLAKQTLFHILKHPHLFFEIRCKVEGLITPTIGDLLYRSVLTSRSRSPNIVEVGAYKGLSTCYLSRAAAQVGKRVKTFELFSGLPTSDPHFDPSFRTGQLASKVSEFEAQTKAYGCREVIDLVIGDARQTMLPALGNEGFSVAFLDADVYEVTREILFQLWSIAKGHETIIIHDAKSPGIRKAIDQFHNFSNNIARETLFEGGTTSKLDIAALTRK